MEVTKYVVEDAEGNSLSSYVYDADEYGEANEMAMDLKARLIEYHFEFTDSEMIEDYTEADES